jgi:hypothetical protein
MQTLMARRDGIEIAYQRFGSIGDPLLLIMGSPPTCSTGTTTSAKPLSQRGFR